MFIKNKYNTLIQNTIESTTTLLKNDILIKMDNWKEVIFMPDHQAVEQMMGYLYQVRYALALLLDSDDDNLQLSIEKFDDIAFSKDGTPNQLIQAKHHIRQRGNLTDASSDLWRTINVWLDAISEEPSLLNTTKFLIITTAIAPDGAASSLLKSSNRDPERAYKMLKEICNKSDNKTHERYYRIFLTTDDSILKKLFENIFIVDNASNILEVEKVVRRKIRYSCLPKYENQIYERLEGWWYKKAIEALCSNELIFVTQNQVRSLIVSISQEYSDENLPIDVLDFDEIQESDLSSNEKVFYEQLKLICVGNMRMKIALRDYYRAFMQRANWIRNDLLFVNELEAYERRLVDEWEHCFAEMEDKLNGFGDLPDEKEKVKMGQSLFTEIEKSDIRIRPKCKEAFVMRGSYHILANKLKIGWHVDFYSRLKNLLNL